MFGIASRKTFPRTLLWIERFVERIVKWKYVIQVDGMDLDFLVFVGSAKLKEAPKKSFSVSLGGWGKQLQLTNLFLKT